MSIKLVVADIFCGAGGMSAGFADAKLILPDGSEVEFDIAYGVDKDADAMKSFAKYHFADVSNEILATIAPCCDIKKITAESIKEAIYPQQAIDVLIGGPNCQGVSTYGLRNPEDKRNTMLSSFVNLVKDIRPKWFVMENVPGLTNSNNRELLMEIFHMFEEIDGYRVAGDVLLAADYGVPQIRYRMFIIGNRVGAPIRFPTPTYFPPSVKALGRSQKLYTSVSDAIGDLASCAIRVVGESERIVDGVVDPASPHNHYCLATQDINRERIKTILPGSDWRSMPIRLLPQRYLVTRCSDLKGAYGRLDRDWPAYTITNAAYNVTAGPFTHPDCDRPISVREAARLQTFEDTHIFYGNVGSQYRQVGNAVPRLLARAVAEAVLRCQFMPDSREQWGREGRITRQVIELSLIKPSTFPTLVPRLVNPAQPRRKSPARWSQAKGAPKIHKTVWDQVPRPASPWPENETVIRAMAKQPGNFKATKRARAIEAFLDGKPKGDIVNSANASEASVRKWIDGYYRSGLDGWRAYHTPVDVIARNEPELTKKLSSSIALVRRAVIAPDSDQPLGSARRLHMNGDLIRMIDRFGEWSVSKLIGCLQVHRGIDVGTSYVDDLLAIADAVFSDDLPQCSTCQQCEPQIARSDIRVGDSPQALLDLTIE